MLYEGHFSFEDHSRGSPAEPWHGFFTCVAEAKSVDAAVVKFDRLIRALAKKQDLFDGVAEIYLDACIELRSLPKTGLLTYVAIRQGRDIGGISTTLLGASNRAAVSYEWGAKKDVEAGDLRPLKPFIRFRRRAKPNHPAPHKPLPPSRGSGVVH